MVVSNTTNNVKDRLENKKLKFIDHFSTPNLYHPNSDDMSRIQTVTHIWSLGDRYYKLANTYYGQPTLWWVIAWFNKKPTEGHLKTGDVIHIPLPLENILGLYDI
tara:strand:+ start:303 stop:617 length:315 start_codon:yes stop_codon:yes gene_type:complete